MTSTLAPGPLCRARDNWWPAPCPWGPHSVCLSPRLALQARALASWFLVTPQVISNWGELLGKVIVAPITFHPRPVRELAPSWVNSFLSLGRKTSVQSNSSCALKAYWVPNTWRKPRFNPDSQRALVRPRSNTQRCKQQPNSQGCSEAATPQDWGVFTVSWEQPLAAECFSRSISGDLWGKVLYFPWACLTLWVGCSLEAGEAAESQSQQQCWSLRKYTWQQFLQCSYGNHPIWVSGLRSPEDVCPGHLCILSAQHVASACSVCPVIWNAERVFALSCHRQGGHQVRRPSAMATYGWNVAFSIAAPKARPFKWFFCLLVCLFCF